MSVSRLTATAEPARFSRESLAAEVGVSPRRISYWIEEGLIPKAHGTNPRNKYYDDTHVAAIRALRAVSYNSATLTDLAAFLRSEGMTIVDYAKMRQKQGFAYA